MSGPELTVGPRRHRRAGPARRPRGPGRRAGRPRRAARGGASSAAATVRVRVRDDRVAVRLWVVARPGQALGAARPPRSGRRSRPRSSGCSGWSSARSPSWSMASGADRVRGRRTGRRLALAAVFEADFGQRTADAVLERHLAEEERDPTAAELARELVAAVVRAPRRDRRRDRPPGAPIPGHRARPDGPRAAPYAP